MSDYQDLVERLKRTEADLVEERNERRARDVTISALRKELRDTEEARDAATAIVVELRREVARLRKAGVRP